MRRTIEELHSEIAERRLLEAELRVAKDAAVVLLKERVLMASIVESSEDAVIGKTRTGRSPVGTWACKRIFGYAAEEMIGRSVFTLISPERHNEEAEVLFTILLGETVSLL